MCKHQRMIRPVCSILLAIVGLALIAVVAVAAWFFVYTGDLPNLERLSEFAPAAPSMVSDPCLAGPSAAIPFDQIGAPLRDAVGAAENPKSMPLQIARSLTCDHNKGRIDRGLKQLRLEWHIRTNFSADQVFIIYANRAYFGPGMTGVENASKGIFQKDPAALGIDEAALLAGLIRAPSVYSPYLHPERALGRRNRVLEDMVAAGKLPAGDLARLKATPLLLPQSSSRARQQIAPI